jgi:hypothetical protein
MRAKEFVIKESVEDNNSADSNQAVKPKGKIKKIHAHHDAPINSLSTIPGLPGMYYGMYRLGVHMAGSPGNPGHENGPTANHMVVAPYTDADADIIDHSAKAMGLNVKAVTSKGSKEPKETNTTSTTAKIKRNKYGV